MLGLFNFIAARWGFKWAYRLCLALPMVIVAVLILLAVWAGWTVGRAPLQVELAHLRATHADLRKANAEAQTQAAQAHVAQLQAAQQRGDQLTTTLARQERQINQLSREKDDAIRRATTGRACLDEPALRVLNSAPGLSVAGLPQATGSAVAEGGPLATYASDLDVGRWAIQSGAQFETCRQRLSALIDWHQEPPHED